MNQHKSTFSLGLLFEGIRQCRMIGIFSLVIVSLGAILPPIGYLINDSDTDRSVAVATEAWSVNPILLAVILSAALMTLTLFHFLDNRAASDLYHALPHKRISLYLSYTGAIVLWVLSLIVVSTVLSLICCGIAHKEIALLTNTVLPYAISVFLMSIQVMGALLLGMSLSGTIFTNIILTIVILFLPRFSYLAISQLTLSGIPFVSSAAASSGIFSNSNNLICGFCMALFDIESSLSAEDILNPNWQNVIYTLCLSLLYLALGALAFCRRRSEAAGQSAPSRMHQHVYRIVITMAYCLFVTSVLTSDLMEYTFDASDIFGYVVLYLIGVLIYFLYELITTRKWRNLLTAMPGLGIVAVLCVGVSLGIQGVQKQIVNQRPAVSEIESVSIGTEPSMYSYYGYLDFNTYATMKTSDIVITDPTVISLISYNLDENVKTWESGSDAYYNKYHTYTSGINDYTQYDVTIRTEKKTLYRTVFIPSSEDETIFNAISSIPEYVDVWKTPPTPIQNTMYVELTDYGWMSDLSEEQLTQLFDLYCKELKDAPFEELYYRQTTYQAGEFNINYSFSENGYTRNLCCPVYSDLMPETSELFFQMLYDQQAGKLEQVETMMQNGELGSANVDAFAPGINCYSYQEPLTQEFYDNLMQYVQDGAVEKDVCYAYLSFYPSDYNQDSLELVVPIDSAFFTDSYVKSNYEIYYTEEDSTEIDYFG